MEELTVEAVAAADFPSLAVPPSGSA